MRFFCPTIQEQVLRIHCEAQVEAQPDHYKANHRHYLQLIHRSQQGPAMTSMEGQSIPQTLALADTLVKVN